MFSLWFGNGLHCRTSMMLFFVIGNGILLYIIDDIVQHWRQTSLLYIIDGVNLNWHRTLLTTIGREVFSWWSSSG